MSPEAAGPAARPYIIPLFISHLGCPFQCVYCQQERITGQETRLPTPEAIRERVDAFLATRKPGKYSHTEVAFYGGTFTGLKGDEIRAMLEALQPYLSEGEVWGLRASTKPDYVLPGILPYLRRLGMRTIELGVQSLDDGVLRAVGRGYTAARVGQAVAELRAAGFQVGIQLMQGLPGADEAEALASAEAAIALRPDFVRLYPTVVLKGTALEHWWRRGEYRPWSLGQAIAVCRALKARFQGVAIPIIKMGLEFSTDEREGILAGPYHPRFHALL
ncbi:MAG: elongator complex protein 3 [Candidatus Binatia bacterium]